MYKIRPALMRDVEEIAQIHVSCWTECYPFLPDGLHVLRGVDQRRQLWADRVGCNQGGIALVLEVGGRVSGFSYTMESNDTDLPEADAELHACYFRPEARRTTAGPQMMLEMIDHAEASGWSSVAVWAWLENPVRRTYAALGLLPVVKRLRVIEGFAAPEVGYLCSDLADLRGRLIRMINSLERRGGASRNSQFAPSRLRPIEIRSGKDQ